MENNINVDHKLLHGGDYNPEQWLKYPKIIKQDIELMQEANVNTITLGVFAWQALEPAEGQYNFKWLDDIIDKIYSFGGKIILATPSGARPQWLSQKYPEVNRTNNFGQKHHHGFRHNHCYSSPKYRQLVKKINTKLAERYGSHPALLMWHISNEYSGECFCDYCQENWRKWLEKKYKSLDNLNEAWWMSFWGNNYTDWSQVLAPSPLGEHKVHGMDLDWKRFVTDQTIDFFNNEIEPLKKINPDIPVTTNFMAEGHDQHEFIPLEGIDYGKFAKHVDIVSWDSYPDWHNNYESLEQTAMKSAYVHDQYYSLKQQPFLVMESTPSVVNWHQFNKSKRPGVHILSSMQQISHGSEGTLYFQWRKSRGGSEKFHGAVIDHDCSEDNRVFKEVKEYGERLKKISVIQGSVKKSRVGIVFDWDSNWALKRGGGFGRPTRKYIQTLQKHYSIFWKQDISVDIITSEHDFSKYSLLIAPMLYLMRKETMAKLRKFTETGGTLVSSYFTGMVNETDLLYLGGMPEDLKLLFGIDVLEIDTLYPEEERKLFYKGKDFIIKDYASIIKVLDATPIAFYKDDYYANRPAAVTKTVNKGRSYYLASRNSTLFLEKFYESIIEELKLKQTLIRTSINSVSIQTRFSNDTAYYFIMNFSSKEKTINLTRAVQNIENGDLLSDILELKAYQVLVCSEKITKN